MWTVIYIASSRKKAEQVKEILSREGILVNIRPVGNSQLENVSGYEVLVLESEAEEANEIINNTLTR
ncbi:MAG: hypothetical protein PWP65_1467 [Clostridia bacterium]|nr:hypothetical protein [Clostridia bacterium]